MILTHFADLQILLKAIYKYGSFLENWAQIFCGFSTWSPNTFFSSCCGRKNSSNVLTMIRGFFVRSSPTIKLIQLSIIQLTIKLKPVLLEFSAVSRVPALCSLEVEEVAAAFLYFHRLCMWIAHCQLDNGLKQWMDWCMAEWLKNWLLSSLSANFNLISTLPNLCNTFRWA